jgi:phosphoribosylglycinamide formyltransferase-1
MNNHSIALFASGNGSNALKIIGYFKENPTIHVALLISNKKDAPIVQKATDAGVEVLVFDNEAFENGLTVLQELDYRAIDWIVLAGFLRKIPTNLINGFPNRIINIHPSLLPKFGGKGMYGQFVHQAVYDAKETETGITIHLVNEEFDKGEILAQFKTPLSPADTPALIAQKISLLELSNFPTIVERTIKNQQQ